MASSVWVVDGSLKRANCMGNFPNLAREIYKAGRPAKSKSILTSFVEAGASLKQVKAAYEIYPDAVAQRNEEGMYPVHVLLNMFDFSWNAKSAALSAFCLSVRAALP